MNTNQFSKDIKLLDVPNTHFEKNLTKQELNLFICLSILCAKFRLFVLAN